VVEEPEALALKRSVLILLLAIQHMEVMEAHQNFQWSPEHLRQAVAVDRYAQVEHLLQQALVETELPEQPVTPATSAVLRLVQQVEQLMLPSVLAAVEVQAIPPMEQLATVEMVDQELSPLDISRHSSQRIHLQLMLSSMSE
jgi:hypothetical protein